MHSGERVPVTSGHCSARCDRDLEDIADAVLHDDQSKSTVNTNPGKPQADAGLDNYGHHKPSHGKDKPNALTT